MMIVKFWQFIHSPHACWTLGGGSRINSVKCAKWTEAVLTTSPYNESNCWGPCGCRFISSAERKEASHPVSTEYVRIQIVVEGDVRELDIQCLPTTQAPHWLTFPCTHTSSMHRDDAVLASAAARQEAASLFSSPVGCYNTNGSNQAPTVRWEMCVKWLNLWKEWLFWLFGMHACFALSCSPSSHLLPVQHRMRKCSPGRLQHVYY